MSVPVLGTKQSSHSAQGSGFILMAMRLRTKGERGKRSRLVVGDWSAPEIRYVPILRRSADGVQGVEAAPGPSRNSTL